MNDCVFHITDYIISLCYLFAINPGDTLLVLGDEEQGIAVVKADVMKEVAVKILKGLGHFKGGVNDETK